MMADEAAKVRLAANAATPRDVLLALATDCSVTVRASVAMNPALPAAVAAILADDPDKRVRSILGRQLKAPAGEGRDQAIANLTAMIADAALRVRASIADAVREMPDGPREIILRLAHDPAQAVCGPVIQSSPLLTPEDLLALIASDPPDTTYLAVAKRPRITEAVSDALVGSAGPDVITALLANRSARIREATLDMLAAQSEEHAAWWDPLTRRPGLPPRAQRILAEIVTGEARDRLANREDLDPSIRRTLAGTPADPRVWHVTKAQPAPNRTWMPRRIQASADA
jgi:uncharacterized protein (DUF2336 family)